MDIRDLIVFSTTARAGSIAAAARQLDCDPSAVSRTLASLERELGIRLLQRTTRRMQLTEAGERYLQRITGVLDELDHARDEAQATVSRPQGRLKVTASNAYGQTVLAPLMKDFRGRFPQISLELLLTDSLVDLVRERVDLALRLGPRPSGDYVISKLRDVEMRLVASPELLAETSSPTSPEELAQRSCLVAAGQQRATWQFRRASTSLAVDVKGDLSTSNTLAVRQFARDGLGYAVLPDWLVEEDLSGGRLAEVLPRWRVTPADFDTGIWIAYPSRRFVPTSLRAFIDFLREQVSRR